MPKRKAQKVGCIICGSDTRDPHHVISVGAGGSEHPQNKCPLCPQHHTEIHTTQRKHFAHKYKAFRRWLISNEWEQLYDGKWFNAKARKIWTEENDKTKMD